MNSRVDFQRPRRPDPESVSYLQSLPLDNSMACGEIHQFLNSGSDIDGKGYNCPESITVALSAIDEIHNEVASLAACEDCAEKLECIARIALPFSETASRVLLKAVQGYILFLSTHRFGSHVLQTLVQLSIQSKSDEDFALYMGSPSFEEATLPSLCTLLLAIGKELSESASYLAVHLCGSHVLRTYLCVLGGLELRQDYRKAQIEHPFRRGKTKKKRKRKQTETYSAVGYRLVYASNLRVDPQEENLRSCLTQITVALTGSTVQSPGRLQELACDSSAGPLLSVLLRVHCFQNKRESHAQVLDAWEKNIVLESHLGTLQPEPRFESDSEGHALAERILCWKPGEEKQVWAPDIIFDLAGDPRGSHLLETLLKVSSHDLFSKILKLARLDSPETLANYVQNSVSCFVVQTLLGSLRDKKQAESVVSSLLSLVTDGTLLDSDQKKRSVLWRLCEAAAKFGVCQHPVLRSLRHGFALQLGLHITRIEDCVASLIDLRQPDAGTSARMNSAGARCLHYLLRFEPKLCRHVLKGIVALPTTSIEFLLRDGLGSRCILDGILQGPVSEPPFSQAVTQIAERLSGRWVSVSGDRIGHHTVIKLFYALPDAPMKRSLAKELVPGKSRLSGSSMGRSVLRHCLVNEFETMGVQEWCTLAEKTSMENHHTWMGGVFQHEQSLPRYEVVVSNTTKKQRTW